MAEVTVPVDAKALAYLVLSDWFPNANVSGLFPGDDDKSMVLPHLGFEIAGGSRLNRITDSAHITIRVWDEYEEDASLLCRRAYAVLMAAPETPEYADTVRKSESVGGPVPYPDPNARVPRYQATVEWQLRPTIEVSDDENPAPAD